jgi:hypothetical protein
MEVKNVVLLFIDRSTWMNFEIMVVILYQDCVH